MRKKNQKDCDKLITPLAKKLNPKCLLCGAPTQVGHHHVHRSKSLILRYDPDNIISLCNSCHFKLHFNESYWASKIVEIKGMEWFKKLDRRKNEIIKPDYEKIYTKLSTELSGIDV
jgi:hypothetical protein